jgi:hypothetical protein
MSRSDRRPHQTLKLRRFPIQLSLASDTRQDQHGKTLNLPGQPKATRRHNRHNHPDSGFGMTPQTAPARLTEQAGREQRSGKPSAFREAASERATQVETDYDRLGLIQTGTISP